MEILCARSLVPFCCFPHVYQEPVKFPSYGVGSVKAQALGAEVDKMLKKGTLEVFDLPGLAYHSHLFQVQKVTGGWKLAVDLSALNH